MSLTVNQGMQAANNLNDLAVPGKDRVAVVEPANRFGSRDNTSFSLETLSIKAPPGFKGNITLVCDASGSVRGSNKTAIATAPKTEQVITWKRGEKAPEPPVAEAGFTYRKAINKDGNLYWQKTALGLGEAKKLASATNAVPTVKSPAAVPTADPKKVSPAPNKEGGSGNEVALNGKLKDKRGVTYWCPYLGDKPLPKTSPDAIVVTTDVGNCYWWTPTGSSTLGKPPPKIIVGPR